MAKDIKTAELLVNYGITASSECGGVLFEVPNIQLVGGDSCEIRLWGLNSESLTPYYLMKGTSSMGSGEMILLEEKIITINIDFAETYQHQCEWPIESIRKVTALNEICIIDPVTQEIISWASEGDTITNQFTRYGESCLRHIDKLEMFGSVVFEYDAGRYYKRWYWNIPVGKEGLYWFFIYKGGTVKNKFSIQLPDLTDGTLEAKDVALTVYARDSEAVIPGASVYIDDLLVGETDDVGTILVQGILQGTHTLKITATGFLDTDIDGLYNDELRVY